MMTERDELISWVQSVLRDAGVAIHNGAAGPRRAIWSLKGPGTVLVAWRNAVGQQELHLCPSRRRLSDCTSYESEIPRARLFEDAAYTVGFKHTSASVDGVLRIYTLRAFQIY